MHKKTKAIKLRKMGYTYPEISDKLGVSKATLSNWLSDLPLSAKVKKQLAGRRSRHLKKLQYLGGAGVKRKALATRKSLLEEARNEFNSIELTHEASVLVGAALYWAEGNKSNGSFRFSNSDPDMLWLMRQWLVYVLEVNIDDITCLVNMYTTNGITYEEAKTWWAKRLKIAPMNFLKPQLNKKPKQSKGKTTRRLFYGVVSLNVRKPQKYRAKYYALLEKLGKDSNEFIEGG